MRVIRNLLLFLVVLVFAAASVAGFYVYQNFKYQSPDVVIILIPKGQSVRGIARSLADQRVIMNPIVFEAYARLSGSASKLKAGEYEFEKDITLEEAVAKMVDGKTKSYQFTIPEGASIDYVCQVLVGEKNLKIDTPTCLRLAKDTSFLKNSEGATSLEGYLFPETYTYDSQTAPEQMFKTLVGMFYSKVNEKRVKKAEEMGFTLHQLVTFASVVEKETGLASERPLIAGVFHNRLKIDMPLQSDPTTIYGLSRFNGNLTRAHLQQDTPYNTYTRRGLPIGPICNPGLQAIDAVLNPTRMGALYFVAKGDGSHYFSETLEQHNHAVRYYQLKQGTEPSPILAP